MGSLRKGIFEEEYKINEEEVLEGLSEFFRANTQKIVDSVAVAKWLSERLEKLGKNTLQEVGDEEKVITLNQIILIQDSVISKELGITERRIKEAKSVLSKIGLIDFYKTIFTEKEKFLKLWLVNLDFFGTPKVERPPLTFEESKKNEEDFLEIERILSFFEATSLGVF